MALVCKECGYKQYNEETIQEYQNMFPNTEEHDIPYLCGACLDIGVIELLAEKWYIDCLNFNIPVSPSDVRDIVEELVEIKEEEGDVKMKKYKLKDYKEFCREALVFPPFEEFDNGSVDENKWWDEHKIQIIANDCVMELDYDADAVNEIDFCLKEIHEAILGDGESTTGNTFGSEYRPAELKDVVRWFIMYRYENWGGLNWFDYARQAVEELQDIQSVIGIYEHAQRVEKDIEFKCNWHNFKIESLKDATEKGIKKIILELVGSDLEISYDPSNDKSFIVDYTFKDSGDFIDWSWGNVNEEEKRILLESYKENIFND